MRILYVTTIAATMEFFPKHFDMLQQMGHTLELACNCDKPMPKVVEAFGLTSHPIPFSRNPLATENIAAFRALQRLIRKGNYDIVHCHTPNAAAITRLVCRKFRKSGLKVVYTAHGFHFYKGAPIANWVIFYPVEWLCAHWTDTLITINHEDYALAQKKMHAARVEYVAGVGMDVATFDDCAEDCSERRKTLDIPLEATVLLSVGELNENKNHETVIKALAALKQKDVYYLIAGAGDKLDDLERLVRELHLENRVKMLGYRRDIKELLHLADGFVFPSYREGLSVALMEAMSCKLPCAVSRIRGNVDLIDEEKGGYLFNPGSVEEATAAIRAMLTTDRNSMGDWNHKKVQSFNTDTVLRQMHRIYTTVDGE